MALAQTASSTAESQVLFTSALNQISKNRHHEAMTHLAAALRIAPAHPEYLSWFGLCIAHVEADFERALSLCHQAVEAVANNPVFLVNLGRVYRLCGDNRAAYQQFQRAWRLDRRHPATAAELTRMGIRRPPFIRFLRRDHWVNQYLGWLRAQLERRLVGRRQL
jgi:Flp pilus assembly protein TadD